MKTMIDVGNASCYQPTPVSIIHINFDINRLSMSIDSITLQ